MATALIILADGFEDIEVVTPIDILRRANINVTVAGLQSNHVKGSRGISLIADTTLDKITEDFDAYLLPGGPGAGTLANSSSLQSILKNAHAKEKIIAAICAAPALILAPLGILNNKTATCFTGMQTHFSSSTSFSTSKVVTDQNIITSRGAGTAFEFGLAIVEALEGRDIAKKIATSTLFED